MKRKKIAKEEKKKDPTREESRFVIDRQYFANLLYLWIVANLVIRFKIIKYLATFKKICKYSKICQIISMIEVLWKIINLSSIFC